MLLVVYYHTYSKGNGVGVVFNAEETNSTYMHVFTDKYTCLVHSVSKVSGLGSYHGTIRPSVY